MDRLIWLAAGILAGTVGTLLVKSALEDEEKASASSTDGLLEVEYLCPSDDLSDKRVGNARATVL